MNEHNQKLWDKVAVDFKESMASVDGTTGLLFVEREGAVAAVVIGDDEHINSEALAKTLRLFRQRLDDMIKHTESGQVDLTQGSKTFIRENETGNYTEAEEGFTE